MLIVLPHSTCTSQLLEGAQLAADLIASYEQSFDPQQARGQQAGVDDFSSGWLMLVVWRGVSECCCCVGNGGV